MRLGGEQTIQVVGEAYREEALERIVMHVQGDRHARRLGAEAVLRPEPDNPHDPNAVMVVIASLHVGYLSREDAARWQPWIAGLARYYSAVVVIADGIVRGGPTNGRDLGRYQVELTMPVLPR